MPDQPKLRKWHFLMLGSLLILLAAFLWYWGWRLMGIPSAVCPENCLVIVSFVLGVIVLGLFIYRLNRKQVAIMLVGMVVVNLLAALLTTWILKSYPAFYNLISPKELAGEGEPYIREWWQKFLLPAIYFAHSGLLLLWIESLVMFLIRKPTDQPE